MLGIRRTRGWRYHLNQEELRAIFWKAFYDALGQVSDEQGELIEVARLVGIFLENGFEDGGDGNIVPASEGTETLNYLEAVVTGSHGSNCLSWPQLLRRDPQEAG